MNNVAIYLSESRDLGSPIELELNYPSIAFVVVLNRQAFRRWVLGIVLRSLGNNEPKRVYGPWNPAKQGEDQVDPKVRAKAHDKECSERGKEKRQ